MTTLALDIATPRVFVPLLEPARYKGAKGGRGSGKSHFFAEAGVERMVADPDARIVCIREVQRSLKFSVKALVEAKIRALGVAHLFTILDTEIRRVGGSGVMIFVGLQDHTAESIKSLEGFDVAWCEEAQALSKRSLQLLRPTIRKPGSELWFSWNPNQPTDPVDELLADPAKRPAGAIVVHANYTHNPFCPPELKREAREDEARDPDDYAHVWLGAYDVKSNARIFAGRYTVDEFTPGDGWDGPYHGADFGFASDPNTLVRCWLHDGRLWIEHEAYKVGQEIDAIGKDWRAAVPECERYVIRADNSEPATISYLKRGGPQASHPLPKIEAVEKWPNSVEQGVKWLRGLKGIVIHPRCEHAKEEARLYSYKVDRHTGDVLPEIEDANNHIWDAVRYALAPQIKGMNAPRLWVF